MENITLRIKDISRLNIIQKLLAEKKPLTLELQELLIEFLCQLPPSDQLLSAKIPLDTGFTIKVWDIDHIWHQLDKWVALFQNVPGFDASPMAYITSRDEPALLRENVIIYACFAPTLAKCIDEEIFQVHLKGDGTASFKLPSTDDAERFPELYGFKGTWKEAYQLMIDTMRKGWPLEEFPEELQKNLPKGK